MNLIRLFKVWGVEEVESYNLTEAKAKLSFIINRIIFAQEKITIRKKGENVAVIMPYDDYIRKWAYFEIRFYY